MLRSQTTDSILQEKSEANSTQTISYFHTQISQKYVKYFAYDLIFLRQSTNSSVFEAICRNYFGHSKLLNKVLVVQFLVFSQEYLEVSSIKYQRNGYSNTALHVLESRIGPLRLPL